MNLNGRVFNVGEMRTTVTLQKRVVVTSAGGFQTETWSKIATVKAKWVNVHGSEAWTASSLQADEPATITIRYRSDFDSTCSVLKNGKIYAVVSMDNIQDRDEYLELKIKRVKAG